MYDIIEVKKVKICFVSLNSYSLLIDTHQDYIGGAELQQVEIAKELRQRGYEIVFITYGENERKSSNGIQILPTYNRNNVKQYSSIKKAFIIYKKMRTANADIYFYRAGSPAIVTFFGKLLGKKVIHQIASDTQFIKRNFFEERRFQGHLGQIGNWFDIKFSDVVISQNEFQNSMLKDRYNINSVEIKNVLHLAPLDNIRTDKITILWVGTIRAIKQPDLFLKIAKHFPEYNFVMIGGLGENIELFNDTKNAASQIKNLDFKGFVTHDKISDYYKKAFLLINTSEMEGVPNVFLEAWMHSIPVISLNVDPDGVLSKYKLGYCSKSFNQLLSDVKKLMEDKKLLNIMGKNGRKYIEENHELKKLVNKYEKLIENM